MSIGPQLGDIWQECDKRFPDRYIKVVKVVVGGTLIQSVERDLVDGIFRVRVNQATQRVAPARWVQTKRFNGKGQGYRFIQHRG